MQERVRVAFVEKSFAPATKRQLSAVLRDAFEVERCPKRYDRARRFEIQYQRGLRQIQALTERRTGSA
jgi:hypothetical protein